MVGVIQDETVIDVPVWDVWRSNLTFQECVMDKQAECMVEAARMQRDASMLLLVAQSQNAIQQLALMAGSEKTAVVSLVAVGQAVSAYAYAIQPDEEVLSNFEQVIATLSPFASKPVCRLRSSRAGTDEKSGINMLAEMLDMTRDVKELLATLASPERDFQGKAGPSRSQPPTT